MTPTAPDGTAPPAPRAPGESVLELKGITKRYPGVVASDDVSFDLRKGEVHALLGENGAGKSTLMNVLYGLTTPDEGEIRVRGELVDIHSPSDAIALGIGMVHQHFMLVPVMTVAENIVLAVEPTRGPLLRPRPGGRPACRAISDRYGLAVDPDALVQDITVGMQQRVEILKALYRGADILILDEPTAVLTPAGGEGARARSCASLTAQGTSVIFITHKLNEVLDIADRVTVLRRGKYIATRADRGRDRGEPRRASWSAATSCSRSTRRPRRPAQPRLEVDGPRRPRRPRPRGGARPVARRSRAGEIVGVAGVDGNGQAELIDAITGLRAPDLRARSSPTAGTSPARPRTRCSRPASGHIPTDRQHRGLVMDFSLAENIALHDFDKPPASRHGWMFPRRIEAAAAPLLAEFDVRGGGRQGARATRSRAATSRR